MEMRAVFEAWAPRSGPWTPWAKAVLFTFLDQVRFDMGAPPEASWVTRDRVVPALADGYRDNAHEAALRTAIVVDLPGVEGIAVGLALAGIGFRPVPLYASLPSVDAAVPMFDVVRALGAGARVLAAAARVDAVGGVHASPSGRVLSQDAPPAFLLDSRRSGPRDGVRPGQFDNRSFVFPSDFPSAATMSRAGIRAVVVLRANEGRPSEDLEVTLSIWERAGMKLFAVGTSPPHAMQTLRVQWPGFFARAWMVWMRARLVDDDGGFGRWVPRSHAG